MSFVDAASTTWHPPDIETNRTLPAIINMPYHLDPKGPKGAKKKPGRQRHVSATFLPLELPCSRHHRRTFRPVSLMSSPEPGEHCCQQHQNFSPDPRVKILETTVIIQRFGSPSSQPPQPDNRCPPHQEPNLPGAIVPISFRCIPSTQYMHLSAGSHPHQIAQPNSHDSTTSGTNLRCYSAYM